MPLETISKAERLATAPWEKDPWGLVSLLDMLRYDAGKFYRLSQDISLLGTLTSDLLSQDRGWEKLQEVVDSVAVAADKLGLILSRNQLASVVDAANAIRHGEQPITIFQSALLELNKRIREELDSRKFCYIPQEKAHFFHTFWLVDSPIYQHKELYDEFQAAGRCYALDESTACVFHLMRCVDWGLRRVAASLGITYDARNWNGIGQAIEKNMQQKYQLKTEEWKNSEPAYAEILTDIQAIGRGHRNPVLHQLEKNYKPRDANYLLGVVEEFCRHVINTWPTIPAGVSA